MRLAGRRLPASLELPAFFALTYAISWSFWLSAAFFTEGLDSAWGRLLVYAGIAGPAIGAIGLTHLNDDAARREDFWDRVLQLRRLHPGWIAAIVLVYPLLTAVGAGLAWSLSGRVPDTGLLERLVASPASLLAYVVLLFALGPIPEELGWRGYALDRLQAHWGALAASLFLGLAWLAWHLPLFFVPGTYQNLLGFGGVGFWLFNLSALAASVLMTLVYNNTARSILGAILAHGVLNFSRAVVELPMGGELARTLLLTALAVCVVPMMLRDACATHGAGSCRSRCAASPPRR